LLYDVESVVAGLQLPVLREGEKEIRCVCPAHLANTGNPDSVGDWSINRETGAHFCFSCQFGGPSVVSLAAYVLDVPVWEASKWCRDFGLADLELVQYEDSGWERRKARRKARKAEDQEVISDAHLAIFEEVPERMLDVRNLERDAADLYEVAWSRENKSWVLPMRMPNAQLIGYQLRAKGWERNHPEDVKKSLTLFGIDKFMTERRAILVESPLDAVRLASVGYSGMVRDEGWCAVASFGAAVSDEQMQILVDQFDEVLVAMDNDKAGWISVNKIWARYRRRLALRFANYNGIDAKDVGDMTAEQIHQAVDRSRSMPLRSLG
jgi:hypothetical protein